MSTRIGVVGYLNARPLTSRIDTERFEVVADHPSSIARMLRDGEIDIGLVPVAAALSDGDFRVLERWCIGADGDVHSVLLVAETPPEQWERVVLDGVSRTSVVLAQLLLAGPLGLDVELVHGAPGSGVESARGTTAAVVIGDVARDLPERLTTRLDLAGLWKEWTGYPFVFAVWAGRPEADPEVLDHLVEAGAAGLAARETDYEGEDLRYVTESIRYELDDPALIGLRRFAALGHAAGLLGTEDVHLYGPRQVRVPRADVGRLLERAIDGGRLSEDEARNVLVEATTADLVAAAGLRAGPWSGRRDVSYRVERVLDAIDEAELDALAALDTPPDVVLALDGAELPDAVARVREGWGLAVRAGQLDHLDAAGVQALADAGVTSLLGTGWAPLDPRVRGVVAPDAVDLHTWVAAVARAASLGLLPVATMAIGRGELPRHRVTHLARLADAGVPALRIRTWEVGSGAGEIGGNTATDWLRTVALARLMLDAELVASWATQGDGPVQAALHAGCTSVGAVRIGSAGDYDTVVADVERHIRDAGREPVRLHGVDARPRSPAGRGTAARP